MKGLSLGAKYCVSASKGDQAMYAFRRGVSSAPAPLLETHAAPILNVETKMLSIPFAQLLGISCFEKNSSQSNDTFHEQESAADHKAASIRKPSAVIFMRGFSENGRKIVLRRAKFPDGNGTAAGGGGNGGA